MGSRGGGDVEGMKICEGGIEYYKGGVRKGIGNMVEMGGGENNRWGGGMGGGW